MFETELKIELDAEALAALERIIRSWHGCGSPPPRTETLVSVYYDTAGHDLAAGGGGAAAAARSGGAGCRRSSGAAVPGERARASSAITRVERPAPGGRLVLSGPDADGALAAVREAAEASRPGAGLRDPGAADERALAAPGGGEVELALDEGEIVAGEASAAAARGGAGAERRRGRSGLRGGAAASSESGPVRFATANKSARGYRLAQTGRRRGAGGAAQRRGAVLRRPRRRWRRWPGTCSATASGRSPRTWWWWPTAPRSRGRTSSGSGCGGCGRRWRCSGRCSARLRWRRSTRRRSGSGGWRGGCGTPTC